MKVSLLNQLSNCEVSEKTEDLFTFNEVPSVKYEQIDQLRCYVDLSVLFFDEYNELIHAGKEDFLTNYEKVNDFIPSSIKDVFQTLNYDPYINIGIDLYEFLQNALIIKKISISEDISIGDLKTLFNNVCTNGDEITDKFICLLLFFELCDYKNDDMINISKFIYASSLYEMTLNHNE